MGDQLRDALLKKGVVSEKQAKHVDDRVAYEERERRRRERLEVYPKNRRNQPVTYGEWYVYKKIPKEQHKLCCMCRKRGVTPEEAADRVGRALFSGGGFMEVTNKALQEAEKIRNAGSLLYRFPLPEYLAMVTNPAVAQFFAGKDYSICRDCIDHARRLFISGQ